ASDAIVITGGVPSGTLGAGLPDGDVAVRNTVDLAHRIRHVSDPDPGAFLTVGTALLAGCRQRVARRAGRVGDRVDRAVSGRSVGDRRVDRRAMVVIPTVGKQLNKTQKCSRR